MREPLLARRRLMGKVVLFFALLSFIFEFFIGLERAQWFDEPSWHFGMAYGMVAYKLIELRLLYLWFFVRTYKRFIAYKCSEAQALRSMKRFYLLVLHGSTIFGIVTYKLTGMMTFFLLFMAIAGWTLWMVNPRKVTWH